MIFPEAVAGLDGHRLSAVSFFHDESDSTCGTCEADLFHCTCGKDFELVLAEAHTLMAKDKTIDLEEAYLQALDNQLGYITRAEIEEWSNPVSASSDDSESVDDEEDDDLPTSGSPWFMYGDDDSMRRVVQARQKKADADDVSNDYNNDSWKCATNHPRKAWGRHESRIDMKQMRLEESAEKRRKTFAENRFRMCNPSIVASACVDLYKNGRDYSYGVNKLARVEIANVLKIGTIDDGPQEVRKSNASSQKKNKPRSTSKQSSISDLALMVHSKTEADHESDEVALMQQEREDAMIADAEEACNLITGSVQLTEEEENHVRWKDEVTTPVLVSNLGDKSQILELPEGRERYWGGEWNIRNKPDDRSELDNPIFAEPVDDDDCPETRPDNNDAPWRTVNSAVA